MQIECEQPTPDLYNFYGKLELHSGEDVTHRPSSTHAYVFGDIALQDASLQNGDVSSESERTSVLSGGMYTNHNRNSMLRNAGEGDAAQDTSLNVGCDQSEITQRQYSDVRTDPNVSRNITDRTTISTLPSAGLSDTKERIVRRNTVRGNEESAKMSNSELQRNSVISKQESDLESRLSGANRASLFENNRSSPLGTENLLLRGARLKNTEFVIGMCCFQ